jgi:metal-responsive CopG/Arc/MetJ family transcriptional regulator
MAKTKLDRARRDDARSEEPESIGVSVRLPSSLLAQIDRLAEQERRTRGNVMRLLLEDALKQRGEQGRKNG